MATTTNYGWTTPDDTSLVKDGASAIRTLGSSVDTTVKNLNPETTLGDISYRSSTANTNTRLAIGTAGQVLTVSGGVPAWTTISSGGMTLISEQTASSISSLSFSSIPGTYKQLMLVWEGIYHSASGSEFDIRVNNDSNNNYGIIGYYGNPTAYTSAASASYSSLGTFIGLPSFGVNNNATSTQYGRQNCGILLIDNYASTSKFKHLSARYGAYNFTAGNAIYVVSEGIYHSTSAVTSIDIFRMSGTGTFSNATNTSIRLYGLS